MNTRLKCLLFLSLIFTFKSSFAQNVGILRRNYFSSYFDSSIMSIVDRFDSATIRLGQINPSTGVVSNIGTTAYKLGVNLTGATINPYLNRYYIGSGSNLLTFDMTSGAILNNVPIYGSLPSSAFQNMRFNNSDSTIYGLVPRNFYSTYYDSVLMTNIEVLDSAHLRFVALNPVTGQYTLIGNTAYKNVYTLAGNSIDPYQMLYYYSAVDTLIGIDLYTGSQYSAVPIKVPSSAIYENIAYSCADTCIYGLTRRNYITSYFDSSIMATVDEIDSVTFRLTKINPKTGDVTFISPYNIGAGGNLSGSAFIDPNAMTYYFSHANQIVGVSLSTGLITSAVNKTYPSGAIAFDMMRSSANCFGAASVRINKASSIQATNKLVLSDCLFPNPVQTELQIKLNETITSIEVIDITGCILLQSNSTVLNVADLPAGIYFAKIVCENGRLVTGKFVKE